MGGSINGGKILNKFMESFSEGKYYMARGRMSAPFMLNSFPSLELRFRRY